MQLEWRGSGVRILDLRGRSRDIEECTFYGAEGNSFVLRAKVKEMKLGNMLVEKATEIVVEKQGLLVRALEIKPEELKDYSKLESESEAKA